VNLLSKKYLVSLVLALIAITSIKFSVDASGDISPFFNASGGTTPAMVNNGAAQALNFSEFAETFVLETTYNHGENPIDVLFNKNLITEDDDFINTSQLKRIDALTVAMRSLGHYLPKESLVQKAYEEQLINTPDPAHMSDAKFITFEEAGELIKNLKQRVKQKTISATTPNYTVEDYLSLPSSYAYSLTPDGGSLFYMAPWNNTMNLFGKELDTGKVYQLTFSENDDVLESAIKNDTFLYTKDSGGNEVYHIYKTDENGKEVNLTPYPNVNAVILDMNYSIYPNNEIIISMNKESPEYFSVYKLNIIDGSLSLFFENKEGYTNFVFDNYSQLCVAEKSDGVNYEYYYRKNNSQEFRKIKSYINQGTFTIIAFSSDARTAYAISSINSDTEALVEVDAPTGEIIREVFKHPNVDLYSLSSGTNFASIGSVTYHTDKPKIEYFDTTLEAVYNRLSALLPADGFISIGSYDISFTKFIISTSSDINRGKYYLYDYAADSLELLSDLNNIPSEHNAKMAPISYKSRDGITIHGYLTLPNNTEAKNLPVVVNPHGGPWARDYWSFNPEAQMLANRGYAVLQMNFRGSVGYGKNFLNLGDKQWGLNMQNDITDGVNWLIKIGVADPERVAIYGASYGGYAALSGMATTPELYAAAVDYVGVSNLFTFLNTIPSHWKPQLNMFYKRVGDPVADKEQFEKTSPALNADKIKKPVFIAQGANDPRVNKAEAEQMVKALAGNNVPYEYMLKENEGHGFAKLENQLEFYNQMINFLDKYVKNK
jgi:dipeptidyl aminopeptidase/acylaminoacyl peptidase